MVELGQCPQADGRECFACAREWKKRKKEKERKKHTSIITANVHHWIQCPSASFRDFINAFAFHLPLIFVRDHISSMINLYLRKKQLQTNLTAKINFISEFFLLYPCLFFCLVCFAFSMLISQFELFLRAGMMFVFFDVFKWINYYATNLRVTLISHLKSERKQTNGN